MAELNGPMFAKLGLHDGDRISVSQGGGAAVLTVKRNDKLPGGCIRLPAGHPAVADLGGLFDGLTAARIAETQKVAV